MGASLGTPLDLGRGNVAAILVRLAAPAIISLFFQNLYTLVDTIFVSWVSTSALAALSLSVPIGYIALALAKGVGVGTTALMSHALGGGRSEQAEKLAGSALPLMLLVLAPLLLLVLPGLSHTIYRGLGATGIVVDESYRYAIWMVLGFPLMGYVTICESIFMSHGDTKTPMQAMIIGNLVNVVLDPLFIFQLKLGVEGASLATLFGWLVSAGLLYRQIGKRGIGRPGVTMGKETPALWKSISGLGVVVFVSMIVSPVSLGIINKILAGYGPAAVGAWSVMSRTELMVVLPMMGLSNALIPFMGHNLGQGDYQRIRGGMYAALKMGGVVMFVAGALVFTCSDAILSIFRLENHVFELARFAVRLSALTYPLMAVELVFNGMAQGLKHPKYSLFTNSLRMLGVRVPLAFIFSAHWGSKGVFLSHPTAIFLVAILTATLLTYLVRIVALEIPVQVSQGENA